MVKFAFFRDFRHRCVLIQPKLTLDKYFIEYLLHLGSLTSQIFKKFALEEIKHLIAELFFGGV